ncbi:hypothetical protein TGRUB_434620, partial [Toxoplasma gondii RUB]
REYKGEGCRIVYLWRRIRPRGERTTCSRTSTTCCRYPSESECPAWNPWANPVAEANDPSSLVSEYAACGVWRPHTVLPFSGMSLVAYLRGWVRSYWLCVVVQSVCEIAGRSVQSLEFAARPPPRGPSALWHELPTCCVWRHHRLRGGMRAWGVVDRGPGGKCFAVCDWQVVFRRGCSLTGSDSERE